MRLKVAIVEGSMFVGPGKAGKLKPPLHTEKEGTDCLKREVQPANFRSESYRGAFQVLSSAGYDLLSDADGDSQATKE